MGAHRMTRPGRGHGHRLARLEAFASGFAHWQYVQLAMLPAHQPARGTPLRPTTAEWMGAALLGGLVWVLTAESITAPQDSLWVALRWTARWSFVWFCLASCSAALGILSGQRLRPLAMRAREFGLAFAAAHLVHVALVAYMLYGATTPFARQPLIFFGIGLGFVYGMALITLSARLREMLGPHVWRALRIVGIEYINYAYYTDFRGATFHKGVVNFLIYAPFLALTLVGPLVRLAALIHKARAARRPRPAGVEVAT
jgi:hypothetical protein